MTTEEQVSRIVRSLGERALDRTPGGGTVAGLHVAADLGIMRDEAERLVAELRRDRER